MKYKLKTRLFAALALSGVSFYWLASPAVAQHDDFGFIRPAEPVRQTGLEVNVPPITQANQLNQAMAERALSSRSLQPSSGVRPPAAMPSVANAPTSRRNSSASAPVPFASSKVFNGAYVVEGNAGVGDAQQVSYQQPVQANDPPPIVSSSNARRGLPPVVQGAGASVPRIVRPIEQNELPPILLPIQAKTVSGVPPIVAPRTSSDRMLGPIQTSGQNSSLLTADGSSLNESSEVELAGFRAGPLVVQEAPPIIGRIIEEGIAGALPSAGSGTRPVDPVLPPAGSSTRPIDPALSLPGSSAFPRETPVDAGSVAPRSVFDQALPLQQPTTPRDTFFGPVDQQAPVYGGGSTCGAGGGSCAGNGGVSACSSCGENGCFDPEAVENIFNSSGSNAYARRYLIAEALYFDRTEGQITNSNFGTLNDFDAGFGARITVGVRSDSTQGREFQYSGIDSAQQDRLVVQNDPIIQSRLVTDGGLVGASLSAFSNATRQEETKESYFHSLEFNRVKWGWDVLKSYIGFRYLYFDDEYSLISSRRAFSAAETGGVSTAAESGQFEVSAINHLFGPQIGGELYYDVGYRWSLSGVSRAGAYLNLSRFDTRVTNNSINFLDTEDTNATIAFTYEAGLNAKYRLTQQAHFRIGYNILLIDNVSTVSDNLDERTVGSQIFVTPTLGSSASDSDNVFFHGLSLGFEIYR